MSISKKDIKLIKSLDQKKYRHHNQLFKVEGVKGVEEFLNSRFEVHQIYATEPIFDQNSIEISESELKKISSLKNPNKVLATVRIPKEQEIRKEGLIVVLDDLRDPGNMGTIIRLCDWFGIEQILCSENTVDCYNSKVVQATMGSLSRVAIHYVNLPEFLSERNANIFGTYMDGRPIYDEILSQEGFVVFGNEANGISEALEPIVNRKLSIPPYGKSDSTESLNVATAAAIVLNEFRRGG